MECLEAPHSHIRAKKTLLPKCWQYKPSENIETLWQVNLPENRLFESSVSSQEVQLDIDGQGVRWWRSRPAAENTLPLLLSTIYIINNIKNICHHQRHLVAVLPALLHIKVFVIVEGIVIKSSESR